MPSSCTRSTSASRVATSRPIPVSGSACMVFHWSAMRAAVSRREQRRGPQRFTSGLARMLSARNTVMLPELPPAAPWRRP